MPWTPKTDADDPDDHHARIDYVLVRGNNVGITADIVIVPWPSDHRASWARVSLTAELFSMSESPGNQPD